MPSGAWTDASGIACAPLPDSPKMKAKAITLFMDVSPCIAVRRPIMGHAGLRRKG
jgi:hypothetical protein